MTARVPIIDVSGLYSEHIASRAAVAKEIGEAIDGLGFFYVKNHNVPEQAMREVRDAAIDFFSMSESDKMKYYVGNSLTHKGFVPEGEEDFAVGSPQDHKEALDIGMELDESHPAVKQLVPFHGHNMWPSELPTFRERVLAYYDVVYDLSVRIMHALALYLGLEETALDHLFTDPLATLRLIHYPHTPGQDGSIGISEHEDFECITILMSDAPGLELDLGDDGWLDVPPLPGTLIVNIGEMLEILTNGRVNPRKHRVRAVSEERLSFPFFLGCNYSTEMKPIQQLVGTGPYDNKYAGVLMGDHLWSAIMQTYRYLIDRVERGEAKIPAGTKVRRQEWIDKGFSDIYESPAS